LGLNATSLAKERIDGSVAEEPVRRSGGAEFQSRFHYYALDAGVGHVYSKPATPRLNGKMERSHRIDQKEFYRMLDGVVIDDTELFNDRLQQWEDFYNFNRPHGGLAGDTPYENYARRPPPRCKRPSSVAHLAGHALGAGGDRGSWFGAVVWRSP
jgi:transposase